MAIIQGTPRDAIRISYCLEDEIGEANPVRIIELIVELVYYSCPEIFNVIDNTNEEAGRAKYPARAMAKLLLYCYTHRIKGSRKIEEECYRNIDLRWLMNEMTPDHWTIAKFRRTNGKIILQVKQKLTEILKNKGYISGKEIVIDGTKVKAYTGKNYNNREEIKKFLIKSDKELKDFMEELEKIDTVETGFNQENEALKKKTKELEETIRRQEIIYNRLVENNKKWEAKTDPDAGMMLSRDGIIPAVNVQMMAEPINHLIIDNLITSNENDEGMLIPTIEKVEETLQEEVKTSIADVGYYSVANLVAVKKKEGLRCFMPVRRKKEEEIKFTYNEKKKIYICSEGKELRLSQKNMTIREAKVDRYKGISCIGCLKREICTKSKTGRQVNKYHEEEEVKKMENLIESPEGLEKMITRKCTIEHIFGTIKVWMGKIPLHLRGIEKIQIEIDIWQIVYNLKRMTNIEGVVGLLNLMKGIMNENEVKKQLKTT